MTATILIIQSDQPLRELLCFALREFGYRIMEAADSDDARAQLTAIEPDLVLLDWDTPDAPELCQEWQQPSQRPPTPMIVLTDDIEPEHQFLSLNHTVDVYLTQPFSPHELLARIRTMLRLNTAEGQATRLRMGELLLDQVSHRVSVRDQTLHMGPTEFRLLAFFIANPDQAYTRHQLLQQVWGRVTDIDARTVDVYIRRLRKALQSSGYPRLIQSVRGVGYRFSSRRAQPQTLPSARSPTTAGAGAFSCAVQQAASLTTPWR